MVEECRTCGAEYLEDGDGYDGECPSCADASFMGEVVERSAPRWAWDIIEETLAMDAHSSAFDPKLRKDIAAARIAMIRASETDDGAMSRAEIYALMEGDDD